MKALFDSGHGQQHWAMTGFPARTVQETFEGLWRKFQEAGYECSESAGRLTPASLEGSTVFVIPSPTGLFNPRNSQWMWTEKARFNPDEIAAIFSYIRDGGKLLAFSYRFGDSFTKANLGELFGTLGCILRDEAVIPLELLEKVHPLHAVFETPNSCVVAAWAKDSIKSVQWRPLATFEVLAGAEAFPIVMSPGGCVRIQWPGHGLLHQSAPICVAGQKGRGKFILFGGPHSMESSDFGMLSRADNSKFADKMLTWLLSDDSKPLTAATTSSRPVGPSQMPSATFQSLWHSVTVSVGNSQKGKSLVAFVEQMLTETKALRLLSREHWSRDREAELDLVFECLSSKPLWAACRGVIPVECKNWKTGADAAEISRFADKVNRVGGKVGLFAARSFTEGAWSAVSKVRLQHEIVIGLLSDEDFRQFLDGEADALAIVEGSIIRTMLL